ncbi:hypothetical protein B0H16DRAFT_1717361 [Mycena metata]|uniref:Uncharacterized protein n=1 Tax=Mycena metata TaxID=1033252 RepID=A0AAD7JJG1_9AGAR|nr:hypothetical protein B0H16DRAFT_1717361 [Mycena metata]
MVNLNLTALAVAATTFSITDFQKFAVVAPTTSLADYNPVIASGSTSAQWIFATTTTAGVFNIQSAEAPTLLLSWPPGTAGTAPGGIPYTQATIRTLGLGLEVQTVNPAFDTVQFVIDVPNAYALTSWPAENGAAAPLTWEVDTGRREQIFTLVSS